MTLEVLIPLLIFLSVVFFIIMRTYTKARIWNLFAVLGIIGLMTYFTSVVIIVMFGFVILWLGYDTFYTGGQS